MCVFRVICACIFRELSPHVIQRLEPYSQNFKTLFQNLQYCTVGRDKDSDAACNRRMDDHVLGPDSLPATAVDMDLDHTGPTAARRQSDCRDAAEAGVGCRLPERVDRVDRHADAALALMTGKARPATDRPRNGISGSNAAWRSPPLASNRNLSLP